MITNAYTRQIFVAYAYNLYDKREYRKVFGEIAKAFEVNFVFADEKITNDYLLNKLKKYFTASDFALFDITGWNPNVALELGLAIGMTIPWYILFNPAKSNGSEVPSNIRGIDRLQYGNLEELKDKLTILLASIYGVPQQKPSAAGILENLTGQIEEVLKEAPAGLSAASIAELTQVHKDVILVALKQMIKNDSVGITGQKKGTRYQLL